METKEAGLASYWKRTLRWKDVEAKRAEGWRVGALHIHSSCSRDVPQLDENRPERLVEKAEREGVDYMTITDHDNEDAWRSLKNPPSWLIRGVEMEVHDRRLGHPVHLGIHAVPDNDAFEELHALAHQSHDAYGLIETAFERGCTVIANHPWWVPRGHSLNSIGFWHLIETFRLPVELNEKRSFIENAATLIYASVRKLPLVAATDSHTRKVLPTCTLARGANAAEFLRNVRLGETLIVPGYAGLVDLPGMMARYLMDAIHSVRQHRQHNAPPVVFESELDRIFRSLGHGTRIGRVVGHPAVKHAAGALAYLSGALLYVPGAYAASAFKVLRDVSLRNWQIAPMPAFEAK